MAPNRKQLAVVLDPFVDTQPLVQAKYLPLTTEVENSVAPSEPANVRCAIDSYDYWTWESPKTAASDDAPLVDLFSAAHVEANLVHEAAARLADTAPIKMAPVSDDAYWEDRVEARFCQDNAAVSERTGYWDWPEDASAVAIALILKEELARQLVSGARMEERLAQDALSHQHTPSQDQSASAGDYWTWETPTIVRAKPDQIKESYWKWDAKETPEIEDWIDRIVAYERGRHLFSADHIVEQLLQQQNVANSSESHTKEATDSYWHWPSPDDEYWNVVPSPVTPTPNSYWSW